MRRKRILAVLLCAVMVFSLTGCKSSDYKSALSMMESGDYEGAREVFTALGGYQDAAAKITECDYHLALNAMMLAKYDEAIAGFEALGDYEDSQSRLTECRYSKASVLFDGGHLAEAEVIYKDLGDYKDSAELVKECEYQTAAALYEEEKYDEALVIFASLADYKECDRYTVLCTLSLDKDVFIDLFAEGMNAYFAAEGTGHTLTEMVHDYKSWTAREFYVDNPPADRPENDTNCIGLSFEHINSEGSSNTTGNINYLISYGYVYPAELIDETYSAFLDTAATMMCVLDDKVVYEEMRSLVDEKMTALKESAGDVEGRYYEEFEYDGYKCVVRLLSYNEVKEYFFNVTIPELVFD